MDGRLRIRLMENRILGEPNAFVAQWVSPSLSSESSCSSDLDTESTGSFYEDGITLGNLIGLQSELGGREEAPRAERTARNSSRRKWWNLCGTAHDCRENGSSPPPSLGQFLEVERRAAASSRRERMYFNAVYDDFSAEGTALGANPLFGDGPILLPELPPDPPSDGVNNSTGGSRAPAFFFGICGGNLAVRMWVWVRRLMSGKHVKYAQQ